MLQPGQYSYSFQVFLPTWLPESSLFKTKKDRFTVEYTLRAQFTPRNTAMFVDHPLLPGTHWDVSAFRGSRRIFVYQPVKEILPKNYKLQIRSNVGVRFFGSSESVCEVRFTRN